jgi:hypothetical protein
VKLDKEVCGGVYRRIFWKFKEFEEFIEEEFIEGGL